MKCRVFCGLRCETPVELTMDTCFHVTAAPPKITPFRFDDGSSTAGAMAQLSCMVRDGDLPLQITWSFHGQSLNSSMGISTMSVGARTKMLTIDAVTAAHSGVYRCLAKNEVGEDVVSAELEVNGLASDCRPFFFVARFPTPPFFFCIRVWASRQLPDDCSLPHVTFDPS
ncbi:unnamed protein product [Notodromas monacha]|uniref:Ig-like domain-containing protein n=1 Tax=Notodromas monacha TaxID=399045 RepID=A0A7R9G7P8_9CRUS|nr:unnamed protein product [Notodromas monacha]CAG0912291.1 unnamed protein product [Notodromas monacha]